MKRLFLFFVCFGMILGVGDRIGHAEKSLEEDTRKRFGTDVVEDSWLSPEQENEFVELLRQNEIWARERSAYRPEDPQYQDLTKKIKNNKKILTEKGFWKRPNLEKATLLDRAQRQLQENEKQK